MTNVLKLVLVAICTLSGVAAFSSSKHSTHRFRNISSTLQFEDFDPEPKFETFGSGVEHPTFSVQDATLEERALQAVKTRLNIGNNAVGFISGHEGDVASYAYVRQMQNGVPFANAVANVAFNKENKLVAFGSSFVNANNIPSSQPKIGAAEAVAVAEQLLGGELELPKTTLEYLVQGDGSVALTHVMQIRNHAQGTWFNAFVDAEKGRLLSVTDFVAQSSYTVLHFQKEYPTEGFSVERDPQDPNSSPEGWHSTSHDSVQRETAGNNVISYKGIDVAGIGLTETTTKESSADLNFNYTADLNNTAKAQSVDAARVNAFYLVNALHDIWYQYGFTEVAYNFQVNNFGKGGKGNDRVKVSVQDSGGSNNANFATPPDGQAGMMRMFLWTKDSVKYRDGALENDVVVHEYTHGLTNRLTGGGTGKCLQSLEAGGLGEGWSDAMADWSEKTSSAVPDYKMGEFVQFGPAIREYPYSTSESVNPLRYSSIKERNEVHRIGEVWANMLHNVYAALVSKHGFSSNVYNASGTEGNIVFLHLFIDGLALQPCNPNFMSARDAWIQADENRYGGANKCLLWRAFASRGLGVGATAKYDDSSAVPAEC